MVSRGEGRGEREWLCHRLPPPPLITSLIHLHFLLTGYLKFGDAVKGSITLNLPSQPVYQYCSLVFAIAIFLSYAIQYYVPFRIIWQWILAKYQLKQRISRPKRLTMEFTLRAIFVTLTGKWTIVKEHLLAQLTALTSP